MRVHIEKLDKRDLRRLEVFCDIVEQGGISNATVSTRLSQPVLSNLLIELEKSLGVKLCQRGRSGFCLTDEGRTVYGYANELTSVLTDFAFKLKGVKSTLTGHVRIGILDNLVTLPNNPIPRAIEDFYQLSDSVEVTIEVGDFTVINEKLAKGQIDMMVVVLGEHQANAFEHVSFLFSEESFLYGRNDVVSSIQNNHFSLENQRINIGGYSANTMYALLDIDQLKNIKLIDGWNVESGIILSLAGTHLSFLPTHIIENNLLLKNLVALQPEKWRFTSEFSLVLREHKRSLSPAARSFYDLILSNV
ncbi:LysR family transcriptional regulator [Psychromonas sp. PT13]|uniref:LysR family transcriptional regulator n=1 Tax=Psychromonas sp. PT13 TaxID=3439547 RepID=UPI003EB8BE3E